VDLIAKRFEARYLETEGKPREALALCREIIEHFAREPAPPDLLPVYLKASELAIKLGDQSAGVAVLVRAAEHFADSGLAAPVADLCHRLPRLDPDLARLHLRYARRMLERDHVAPACELLRDLAVRRKKTALRQTLERMASWPEPIVRGQLLEFLDRAEARPHAAEPPAPEIPAQPEPPPPEAAVPEPAAPSVPEPPAVAAPAVAPPAPAEPVEPREPRRSPVPPPSAPPFPPPDVEFVEPAAREPRLSPPPVPGPRPRPIVPMPRRHRRHRAARWLGVAAAGVLVAAGVWLAPRVLWPGPEVGATSGTPGPAPATVAPALDDTGRAAAPVTDSVVMDARQAGGVVPPSVEAVDTLPAAARPDTATRAEIPSPAVTPASAVGVPPVESPPEAARQPPDTTRPAAADTVRPAVSAPEPPAPVDTRPAVLRVDYPLVVVGGLEAVRVGLEGEGAARRVVVLQLLPEGDTLELREADLGPESMGVGGGRILVSPHPSGGAMGTARVGQFLVTARAPIAPDALEPFLRRLVEVRP